MGLVLLLLRTRFSQVVSGDTAVQGNLLHDLGTSRFKYSFYLYLEFNSLWNPWFRD